MKAKGVFGEKISKKTIRLYFYYPGMAKGSMKPQGQRNAKSAHLFDVMEIDTLTITDTEAKVTLIMAFPLGSY